LAGPTRDEGPGRAVREAVRRLRDLTSAEAPTGDERQAGIEEVGHALRAVAGEHGDIELVVGTNRITFGDDAVYKSDARENNLAFELFRQGLRRITFRSGLTDEEIETFVRHFAECREIEKVDEDFVSTLWRESMPGVHYVAIDGFTEKIFMADEAFTSTFRAVIDDVCPGLLEMAEEDEADLQPRPRQVLDAGPGVSAGLDQLRATSKALATTGSRLRTQMRAAQEGALPLEHLLELLAAVAVKSPCALPDDEAGHALLTTLDAFYAGHGPQAFADAARTVLAVTDAARGCPDPTRGAGPRRARSDRRAARLGHGRASLRQRSAGGHRLAALVFHFTAGVLTAPDLLGLINSPRLPGAALAFLKDLLRRQGTSSLEPWAERLRDDNPGRRARGPRGHPRQRARGPGAAAPPRTPCAIPSSDVRSRAIDGLRGAYSAAAPAGAPAAPARSVASAVRRAVLSRFALAADASVATYVAATIKAPMFLEFDDDEQRAVLREPLVSARGRAVHRGLPGTSAPRGSRSSPGIGQAPAARRRCPLRHHGPPRRARGPRACSLRPRRTRPHSRVPRQGRSRARGAVRRCTAHGDPGRSGERRRRRHRRGGHRVPCREDSAAVVAAGADKLGSRARLRDCAASGRATRQASAGTAAPCGVDARRRRLWSRWGGRADTALRRDPAGGCALPLSELPLLADGEVFLADDERRLRAEPGHVEDGRFTLTSPRVALVGAPATTTAQALPAAAIAPTPSRTAARVVERTAPAAGHADWTHQPDATLADILSSYLDDEGPAPSETPPRVPAPTAKPVPAPPRRSTVPWPPRQRRPQRLGRLSRRRSPRPPSSLRPRRRVRPAHPRPPSTTCSRSSSIMDLGD
jgi:hypothetical protein